MPPSSETMTGIAGETMVWLTAATSMPSISPTKITFLRETLFNFPSAVHDPGDDPEHPAQLRQLLLGQLPPYSLLELLAEPPAALDQASPLLRGVQSHHPVVLRISLPTQQTFHLEPLREARNARGIHFKSLTDLSLAH